MPAGRPVLARGDEVNDDPVAGIDPAREVLATPDADRLNSDKAGVPLMGGVKLPWTVFGPGAEGADQQVRSVARPRFARATKQYRELGAMLAILGATVGRSAFATSAQATVVSNLRAIRTRSPGATSA